VASAPSAGTDLYAEQDFSPVTIIHYIESPDHPNAAQELATIFADLNTDTSLQVGVTVGQKMYAFTKDLSANAVVIDYVIAKRPVDTASNTFAVTDASAAALFMDWDIGSSGSLNQAYSSSLDPAISITRRVENLYP